MQKAGIINNHLVITPVSNTDMSLTFGKPVAFTGAIAKEFYSKFGQEKFPFKMP